MKLKTLIITIPFLFQLPALASSRLTATVYDPGLSGNLTSCGQVYRHWGVSAAHPFLPCGSKVRVSYRGRSLNVTVTDRCNCDIDLSGGAASYLRVPLNGIATVKVSY